MDFPLPQAVDEPIYCATCRFALDGHRPPGGMAVRYEHTEATRRLTRDHAPVPLPISQVPNPRQICDCCSTPDPIWVYASADIQTSQREVVARKVATGDYQRRNRAARTRGVEYGRTYDSSWGERWAICDGCAALIEAGDLLGLVGQATSGLPGKYTRSNKIAETRALMMDRYTEFLATLTPGRGRITADSPTGVWEPAPRDEKGALTDQ